VNDREHMVQMLARQVLAMPNADGSEPAVSGRIADAGHATVEIEMRGIIHNIRRQIWVDGAAINKRICDEIDRQAAEVDMQAEITKAVRAEITSVLHNLVATVRTRVNRLVEDSIDKQIGTLPQRIARKFADRLWREAFDIGKED
jgi:predicted ATPase